MACRQLSIQYGMLNYVRKASVIFAYVCISVQTNGGRTDHPLAHKTTAARVARRYSPGLQHNSRHSPHAPCAEVIGNEQSSRPHQPHWINKRRPRLISCPHPRRRGHICAWSQPWGLNTGYRFFQQLQHTRGYCACALGGVAFGGLSNALALLRGAAWWCRQTA